MGLVGGLGVVARPVPGPARARTGVSARRRPLSQRGGSSINDVPEYLAPGVYVEEVSYRSKSIEGSSPPYGVGAAEALAGAPARDLPPRGRSGGRERAPLSLARTRAHARDQLAIGTIAPVEQKGDDPL